MTDEMVKTREEAHAALDALILEECRRRWVLYRAMTVLPDDPHSVHEEKHRNLLVILNEWARDPLRFISDIGWAHDPRGVFGSRHIPPGLAPKGMVPMIPFRAQADIIKLFPKMLDARDPQALVALKARQVAFTTIFMLLAFWAWLFRPSCTGVLGSYKEEYIDRGGKGQRESDSLFGRIRMSMDAMFVCLPQLRFGNQYPRNSTAGRKLARSTTGLGDADDITYKLTRPFWAVYKARGASGGKRNDQWIDPFPSAQGNWLSGALPDDNFARSLSGTFAMMDEIGQYNDIRAGSDREAWSASAANFHCRIAWGTIPRKGATGTKFYELMEDDQVTAEDALFAINRRWVHWSDIGPYMAGAYWNCRKCKVKNEHPVQPGPGREGTTHTCSVCHRTQKVMHRDVGSPWFEIQCAMLQGDKVAIAREYQMDWMSSQGDVLFTPLDATNVLEDFDDSPIYMSYEGFDPGYTHKNPGAWILSRFEPSKHTHHIVGYWMSSNPMSEYWVPFFKRWNRKATARNRILYGKYRGRTFQAAFEYPEEALRMMDRCSKYPLGHIEADKFVSHSTGGESAYENLTNYGIVISYVYTKSREELVRKGVEWSACLRIDSEIADVRPPTTLSKQYPSVLQCFTTAKPTEHGGQAVYKLDVDKQNPPHVNNLVDAYFYLIRGVGVDTPHSVSDSLGVFSDEPIGPSSVVRWGDGSMGF